MNKFKIGDRVRVQSSYPCSAYHGAVGRIYSTNSETICIKYEGDGKSLSFPVGTALGFPSENLELVGEVIPPTPAELAAKYRKANDDALDALRDLTKLGYKGFCRKVGASSNYSINLGDGSLRYETEFRKEVTTTDVV